MATTTDVVRTRQLRGARPLIFGAVFVAGLVISSILTTTPEDLHERSDRFWALTRVRGMAAESFTDLGVMAKSADAVVVGRIVEIAKGREWVANPNEVDDPVFGESALARFATATILIEEVIGKTTYPVRDRIALEIFLPQDKLVPHLEDTLPLERSVFFLRNKGPEDSTDYYRLVNDEQGLVREFGGVSHTFGVENPMLARIEGGPFSELLAELRKLDS